MNRQLILCGCLCIAIHFVNTENLEAQVARGSAQVEVEVDSPREVHLFVLSGQSNMAGLDPDSSFTPYVTEKYGAENVLVVKDALSGAPIRRWVRDWKSASGESPEVVGDMYDRLIATVKEQLGEHRAMTVSFVWMQGERDARERHGEVYQRSLEQLCEQLQQDLMTERLNVVIGRLSDFDMDNQRYPHWTMVREAQLAFVEEHPSAAWVDTDDLNDGQNRQGKEIVDDLHYSVDGYVLFGQRCAEQAVKLIEAAER